jgi:acetyltransferase-like isoleucine patch superfamily enzyme
VIRQAISSFYRLALGRRYEAISIGAGSRVDFWKLSPKSENRIEVGRNSMFASRVVYERSGARLKIGARTFVARGLMSIADHVDIGDDVLISWGVTILDHHSHSLVRREREHDVEEWLQGRKDWEGIRIAPVTIENWAWIGFNVSVLAGVTIGEGAIVGAGSIVTKDVPAWTIAAGNPARLIREQTAHERT